MLGRVPFLIASRLGRAWHKLASLLYAGAFQEYGRRSVIERPLRLAHPECISVGSGVFIGGGSWLQAIPSEGRTPRIRIGDRCSVSGTCVLSAACELVLEDAVLLARNVYISDHIHGYTDTERPIRDQGVAKVAPVRIERGAWLGQNVVVCPGVTIGTGSVVGANSVVTESIPPHSLAVGSPAKVVKRFGDAS